MFLAGAAFLLKMCYLSLAFNTGFGIAYLTILYFYCAFVMDRRCRHCCWAWYSLESKWTRWEIIFACMATRSGRCNMTSLHT